MNASNKQYDYIKLLAKKQGLVTDELGASGAVDIYTKFMKQPPKHSFGLTVNEASQLIQDLKDHIGWRTSMRRATGNKKWGENK